MAEDTTRRRLLALAGTTVTTTLAGCSSVLGGVGGSAADEPAASSDTPTATASPVSETTPARTETTPARAETTPGDGAAETTTESWSTADVTIDPPTAGLVDVPVSITDERYARMGTGEAETTATLFGNWKCPYTREFVLTQLPGLADEYVRTGDVELEFRALAHLGGEPFLGPDAPRAARAGLAVWNSEPDSFWEYTATVFENQPQERREWAKTSLLVRFVEAAGVGSSITVERAIERGKYAEAVQATTTAAADLGIGTVPRMVVDGEVTAPTVNPENTREQLERASRD